jgi:glutaredoxin
VIIFSKTYCPHSKKAKHILLDLYAITPPPVVIELDTHEQGVGLQAALAQTTGRKTVPNVLVNGKTIGGGDEVEALHMSDGLVQRIQELGGTRVQVMKGTKA